MAAGAESDEHHLEEINFNDIVFDATDEMWTLANSKQMTSCSDVTSASFPVQVDRGLLTRALANLLSNAINYSPEGTAIICSMTSRNRLLGGHIACSITDQG